MRPQGMSARNLAHSKSQAPMCVMITDSHGQRYMYQNSYEDIYVPSLQGQSPALSSRTTLGLDGTLIRADILTYLVTLGEVRRIKELVPIRVDADGLATQNFPKAERYLIYWHEKTVEFLEMLPERIRTDIGYVEDQIEPRPLAKEQNDLIQFPQHNTPSVFPNHTNTSATLSCTFDDPRSIGVALYDITGRKGKEISNSEIPRSGAWSQQVPLADVLPGGTCSP